MFTYNGRDAHRNLTPARVHLPPKGTIVEILPERIKTDDDEVRTEPISARPSHDLTDLLRQADPALLRLPAPGLRGTWARAYALLTRLVSQIGWDELLKTRSSVFVMEEEYRMQKAHSDAQVHTAPPTKVIHEDGTVSSPKPGASDDASTRGMVSPTTSVPEEDGEGAKGDGDSETHASGANGLPTIRISTESAREAANGHLEAKENGVKESTSAGDSLEKPIQAAENQDGEGGQAPSQEPFSFSNKRLCERWLDNLFMVLYEVRIICTSHILCPDEADPSGSPCMDNLPCGGCPLQDAARRVSQDWTRMGDTRRLGHPPSSQGGSQRSLPALPRYPALLVQAVVQAFGHVC